MGKPDPRGADLRAGEVPPPAHQERERELVAVAAERLWVSGHAVLEDQRPGVVPAGQLDGAAHRRGVTAQHVHGLAQRPGGGAEVVDRAPGPSGQFSREVEPEAGVTGEGRDLLAEAPECQRWDPDAELVHLVPVEGMAPQERSDVPSAVPEAAQEQRESARLVGRRR